MTSDELKAIRKSLHLTQKEFGALIFRTARQIQNYESGFSKISELVESLIGLCLVINRLRELNNKNDSKTTD